MKFTRLRLTGFKSFVEPTEILIEPGLTGIVGPNGCGKSNLLEALRWVMGESSYKSMRAAGMEDVIFSGTTQRPSRNLAEVLVTLSNDDRTAPAPFNDSELLEISRTIVRDEGSTYKLNGKELRAKDVQLLFADASTGSRSPALVRQGQIAEIINAKPQARRVILEEAAGIAGLHTRRHEAELKLKAAEQNLARIDDVMAQLESQLNSLKRQARQAQKYKQVSADIRKLEAASLFVAWRDAEEAASRDAALLEEATRLLAEHTRVASEKLRRRDTLGESLPGLREQETVRAAVLQRLSLERAALDEEEKRVEGRITELKQGLAHTQADLKREHSLLADTETAIARLTDEEKALHASAGEGQDARAAAAAALQQAADTLARAQDMADEAGQKLSEFSAARHALERNRDDAHSRLLRLEQEQQALAAKRSALSAVLGDAGEGLQLAAAVEAAQEAAAASETDSSHAEVTLRVARQVEADKRQAYDDARRKAEQLQTEIRTLATLLKSTGGELWPTVVDALKVRPGYEAALAAALGDDLEASSDEGAPLHWRSLPPLGASATLPGDATPLSLYVEGPAVLSRRLSHVGVVAKTLGASLQGQLRPGQKLVSLEGDVWRWDGFVAAGDAPSASAKRLAERNRLEQLESALAGVAAAADAAKADYEEAKAAVEHGARAEREKREAWRSATAALDAARRALQAHERRASEQTAQSSALEEAQRRTVSQLMETGSLVEKLDAEFASLPDLQSMQAESARLRDALTLERTAYGEARARHDSLEREVRMRAERLAAIASETEQWKQRAARAGEQARLLQTRAHEAEAALSDLAQAPQQMADRRLKLLDMVAVAERERAAAADALQDAENLVRTADRELREAQELSASSREEHARVGTRLEASRQDLQQSVQRIAETLHCEPHDVLGLAGLEAKDIPPLEEIERRTILLREDRERLGAVNLRADEEAAAVGHQLDGMKTEKDELAQAIAKLRGAIGSLNREGRQRLLDSFGTVNAKFTELFTTLFGGGEAELQLIESDDPLEAGLEIMARPPGKKTTTLSLLSGGEQTLTALALIFAVFLTNPSPICVLDEVDAPLDDHNVERFCNLLYAMLERTDTRFLVITHHPITMARMNRLFGVTMMERGVSQLVSVNLEEATELAEAS
jgi:chromosome segregation protein